MSLPEWLPADPLVLLETWIAEASASGAPQPHAMTLATSAGGAPSARVVLHKGISDGGVLFFTNYESRKARELGENAAAALVFYWAALERQVRLEGRTKKTTRAESEAYFRTRPRESQIGAWASPQSEPVAGRDVLERRVETLVRAYEGREVPCPPFWGGYRLTPEMAEFWVGQAHRLHDRFRYRREGGGWKVDRLAP